MITVEQTISKYFPSFLNPILLRLLNSKVGYRLAKGLFWSITGTVISRGLMLVATVLVARTLGKTGYGELGIIQSTVGMFGVFAGFGLGLTATKHVAEFRKTDLERTGRLISLSCLVATVTGGILSIGLFLTAPLLAKHAINAPHLASMLRVSALILFLNAVNGAQTGALAGFEAFKRIAHVNALVGLTSFGTLVLGAYLGGLTGAVWALAFNLGLNWLLNHIALRKEARLHGITFSLKGCIHEREVLWSFSLPAVFASSMNSPINWLCSALLVNQPSGYAEMAIFSAANQWYAIAMFLPLLLNGVILPILSEEMGGKSESQSLRTLVLAIKVNLALAAPIILLGIIASPYIMAFYGSGFRSGWPTLIILLLEAGIMAGQAPVGAMVAATGKMWVGFAMNSGWALVYIVSALLLIQFGSLGLSTARTIGDVIHTGWLLFFILKMKSAIRPAAECIRRSTD